MFPIYATKIKILHPLAKPGFPRRTKMMTSIRWEGYDGSMCPLVLVVPYKCQIEKAERLKWKGTRKGMIKEHSAR